MTQYEESDGAIALLGTSFQPNGHYGKAIVYTKSHLLSVPQVVPYNGYDAQPTEVVSAVFC